MYIICEALADGGVKAGLPGPDNACKLGRIEKFVIIPVIPNFIDSTG